MFRAFPPWSSAKELYLVFYKGPVMKKRPAVLLPFLEIEFSQTGATVLVPRADARSVRIIDAQRGVIVVDGVTYEHVLRYRRFVRVEIPIPFLCFTFEWEIRREREGPWCYVMGTLCSPDYYQATGGNPLFAGLLKARRGMCVVRLGKRVYTLAISEQFVGKV